MEHFLCGAPADVLLRLLTALTAATDVGQVVRLAAASTAAWRGVMGADYFWQTQCAALGWIRAGVQHPALTTATQQQPNACSSAAASHLWSAYFKTRMSCRWRLRRLFRQLLLFLNIHSRLAVQPGASIAELQAAEARLGTRLPWELWELCRFRAGQAPGPSVVFAGSCRLLELHELQPVQLDAASAAAPSLAPEHPPTQQQQLETLQAQLPLLGVQHQPVGTASTLGVCGSADDTGQPPPAPPQQPPQHEHQQSAVVFLSTATGSPSYAAAVSGEVWVVNGWTCRRAAGDVCGFLRGLLA